MDFPSSPRTLKSLCLETVLTKEIKYGDEELPATLQQELQLFRGGSFSKRNYRIEHGGGGALPFILRDNFLNWGDMEVEIDARGITLSDNDWFFLDLPVGDEKRYNGTDLVRVKGWYEEGGIFQRVWMCKGNYPFQKTGIKIQFFKGGGMIITREFVNGGGSDGRTSFSRGVALFNKLN